MLRMFSRSFDTMSSLSANESQTESYNEFKGKVKFVQINFALRPTTYDHLLKVVTVQLSKVMTYSGNTTKLHSMVLGDVCQTQQVLTRF